MIAGFISLTERFFRVCLPADNPKSQKSKRHRPICDSVNGPLDRRRHSTLAFSGFSEACLCW